MRDLEFQDFIEIYEDDIYCAYMETGCYYDMELEDFEELEYEDYLQGSDRWAEKPKEKITLVRVLSDGRHVALAEHPERG